jgi:hypothetical protein
MAEDGNPMAGFCNDFLYQCVSKEVSLLIADELLVLSYRVIC